MTSNEIKELLLTFQEYDTVDITHTFKQDEKSICTVSYNPQTKKTEIAFVESQTCKKYDDVEEAAEAIKNILGIQV